MKKTVLIALLIMAFLAGGWVVKIFNALWFIPILLIIGVALGAITMLLDDDKKKES